MPRRNRDIPTRKEGTLVEVSTRCLHAAYLLTPTSELTDIAVVLLPSIASSSCTIVQRRRH